jgi:hypothetical protein
MNIRVKRGTAARVEPLDRSHQHSAGTSIGARIPFVRGGA